MDLIQLIPNFNGMQINQNSKFFLRSEWKKNGKLERKLNMTCIYKRVINRIKGQPSIFKHIGNLGKQTNIILLTWIKQLTGTKFNLA